MTIRKLIAVALCAAMGCGLAGCFSASVNEGSPKPVENVSVTLAQGRTLPGAIMAAATRRRWLPQEQPGGTIRCTLSQREHLVVVDVVPNGSNAFSIRFVQSNIPVRKYDQWVNNLSREIVFQAAR